MCMTKCFSQLLITIIIPASCTKKTEMELCTHVKLSYKQYSNDAMNYTRQIPSKYNYALTDCIELCYERCLNHTTTILGNAGQILNE